MDLAAFPGQLVRAAGAGHVTFARTLAGRGVVTVTHGTLRTTYEPVTASVKPGDAVQSGTPLGTVQPLYTHCTPLPCLHWGLRRAETYLDPLSVLPFTPIRLLPHWESPPP